MASRRISAFAPPRTIPTDSEPTSKPKSSEEKNIWEALLDSVSSGKKLPEKSALILGGTPETQKDFLESLTTDASNKRRPIDRTRRPPIANQFALGYTYQDVLDDDQEDTLARLSLYLLTDPSPSFTPLLKPLLKPQTIPHMLLVILLDWSEPWAWLRQLRDWMRVWRGLMASVDIDSKDALEENNERLKGGEPGEDTKLPEGHLDELLGMPVCVVCQNADKIEQLERERGWKEDDFDFILECLRTVLLKHGASLVYTMPSRPGSLQSLIHSQLGIQATLKRQSLKYNVTDRDSVLIPPHWDSWGKIRTLREGFDIEGMSKAWDADIQYTPTSPSETAPPTLHTAVTIYEETVINPAASSTNAQVNSSAPKPLEISGHDNQSFLSEQQELLTTLQKADEEDRARDRENKRSTASSSTKPNANNSGAYNEPASNVVEEQIGPVQFNMGGIQVDAEDVLAKINARENERAASPVKGLPPTAAGAEPAKGAEDGDSNERLKSFFAGLMNRK